MLFCTFLEIWICKVSEPDGEVKIRRVVKTVDAFVAKCERHYYTPTLMMHVLEFTAMGGIQNQIKGLELESWKDLCFFLDWADFCIVSSSCASGKWKLLAGLMRHALATGCCSLTAAAFFIYGCFHRIKCNLDNSRGSSMIWMGTKAATSFLHDRRHLAVSAQNSWILPCNFVKLDCKLMFLHEVLHLACWWWPFTMRIPWYSSLCPTRNAATWTPLRHP